MIYLERVLVMDVRLKVGCCVKTCASIHNWTNNKRVSIDCSHNDCLCLIKSS